MSTTETVTIRRPHQILNGLVHYLCRGKDCRHKDQWLHEEYFHPLRTAGSKCKRASECKECANARRRRSKAAHLAAKRRADVTPVNVGVVGARA